MRPHKVLVTGGTGFIGGRLCELLSLEHRIPYRALVRNFTRAGRIARLGAEMLAGDLLDPRVLDAAVADCDAVVHLADSGEATGERGLRTLLATCRRARVRRFVHISSMAVLGPSPAQRVLTEAVPPIKRSGESYSDAKALSEAMVVAAIDRYSFPAVILRPTVVYGPYSYFVEPIIEEAQRGRMTLIDGGSGICNAVYVDDVCDAIIAALLNDDVVGSTYFINGDNPLTWHEFITTFADMVGPTVRLDFTRQEVVDHWLAQRPAVASSLTAMAKLAVSPSFHGQLSTVPALGALIRGAKGIVAGLLTEPQKLHLRSRLGKSPAIRYEDTARRDATPRANRVVREAYASWISNDLAKQELGWRPGHTFQQGAAKTSEWLRFARMI